MEQTIYRDEIATLAESYAEGYLIPFAGAGLSRPGGIPNWKELTLQMFLRVIRLKVSPQEDSSTKNEDGLRELLDELVSPHSARTAADGQWNGSHREAIGWFLNYLKKEALDNDLITMRYVKTEMERRQPGEFHQALHDELYRWRERQPCPAYRALGRWCQSRPHGRALEIVNYNYDDLLEQTLDEMGVHKYCSLSQSHPHVPGRKREQAAILYHPHGLVPQSGKDMTDIVLSEEEYHDQYSNIASWANLTQLRLLWQGRGLFIGLSMTDPNLRRLMDMVRKGSAGRWHYLLMRRIRERPPKRTQSNLPPDADYLFRAIGRSIEELRVGAFSTLDVRVIWFDDYEEVPQILDCIRLVAEDPGRLDRAEAGKPVWQSIAEDQERKS